MFAKDLAKDDCDHTAEMVGRSTESIVECVYIILLQIPRGSEFRAAAFGSVSPSTQQHTSVTSTLLRGEKE